MSEYDFIVTRFKGGSFFIAESEKARAWAKSNWGSTTKQVQLDLTSDLCQALQDLTFVVGSR